MIEQLKCLYYRDLNKLKSEISAYTNTQNLWKTERSIANSAGNLCLHIVGNLNAYIGIGLAKTNYLRNRELEFSAKGLSKTELIDEIDKTISVVLAGLDQLSEDQLEDDFPILVWDKPSNMGFTIVHLAMHLNYHLGQINYCRRMLDRSFTL